MTAFRAGSVRHHIDRMARDAAAVRKKDDDAPQEEEEVDQNVDEDEVDSNEVSGESEDGPSWPIMLFLLVVGGLMTFMFINAGPPTPPAVTAEDIQALKSVYGDAMNPIVFFDIAVEGIWRHPPCMKGCSPD